MNFVKLVRIKLLTIGFEILKINCNLTNSRQLDIREEKQAKNTIVRKST